MSPFKTCLQRLLRISLDFCFWFESSGSIPIMPPLFLSFVLKMTWEIDNILIQSSELTIWFLYTCQCFLFLIECWEWRCALPSEVQRWKIIQFIQWDFTPVNPSVVNRLTITVAFCHVLSSRTSEKSLPSHDAYNQGRKSSLVNYTYQVSLCMKPANISFQLKSGEQWKDEALFLQWQLTRKLLRAICDGSIQSNWIMFKSSFHAASKFVRLISASSYRDCQGLVPTLDKLFRSVHLLIKTVQFHLFFPNLPNIFNVN